ncbi:MAG TPA: SCO family protein [Rhizobiaceae bacterium]|nr:SCO family protein [Rhizobiaceae bacterium]
MKRLCMAAFLLSATSAAVHAGGLDLDGNPLLTASGEAVKFSSELFDAPATVISFTFTGCRSICPVSDLVMSHVADMADETGADVALLTFTIDPLTDSPAVLAAHRERYGFKDDKNWRWITGEPGDVWNVLDRLGMETGALDDHESFFIVAGKNATEAISLWESTTTAETILAAARDIAELR